MQYLASFSCVLHMRLESAVYNMFTLEYIIEIKQIQRISERERGKKAYSTECRPVMTSIDIIIPLTFPVTQSLQKQKQDWLYRTEACYSGNDSVCPAPTLSWEVAQSPAASSLDFSLSGLTSSCKFNSISAMLVPQGTAGRCKRANRLLRLSVTSFILPKSVQIGTR